MLRGPYSGYKYINLPSETPELLVFYEAQLALLQQLSQTRLGAMHVLEAGLFEAVKESQLFAADPDIGLGKIYSVPSLLMAPLTSNIQISRTQTHSESTMTSFCL